MILGVKGKNCLDCACISPGCRLCVHYLVGVSMCERCVVLAGAVGGPVFVHGGGGRGFVQ